MQLALRIQSALDLDQAGRTEEIVLHVLFSGPQHFYRRAIGHFLGNQGRHAGEILRAAATTQAATELHRMHMHVLLRHTGCRCSTHQRAFEVLRRDPDVDPTVLDHHRGAHRFHGRVRQIGREVLRLQHLGRFGKTLGHIAIAACHCGVGCCQTSLEHFHDAATGDVAIAADVPVDGHILERFLGAPPAVTHHRHETTLLTLALHHLDDAATIGELGGIKRFDLATEHRALRHRGIQHAGHLRIDTVALTTHDGVLDVAPLHRLAGNLPVLRVFQCHFLRCRLLGCGIGQLAVAQLLVAGLVDDHAVLRHAFTRRDIPLLGSSGDQHFACGGTGLAQIFLRVANSAAAHGRHIAPDALAAHLLVGQGVFDLDLLPVGFQFLGHQLRCRGHAALTHLGAGVLDDHGVIGTHLHPGIDFGSGLVALTEGRQIEADGQAATDGGRGLEETAAGGRSRCAGLELFGRHGCVPLRFLVGRLGAAHHLGGGIDRCMHAGIGAATADVGHMRIDIGSTRIGFLLQQVDGHQDLSALAVAALRHFMIHPGLLHRMRTAALGQTFDGGDLAAGGCRHRVGAGTYRLTIDQHGAGAALRNTATIFRALDIEFIAQRPQQGHVRLDVEFPRASVDVEFDHGVS